MAEYALLPSNLKDAKLFNAFQCQMLACGLDAHIQL